MCLKSNEKRWKASQAMRRSQALLYFHDKTHGSLSSHFWKLLFLMLRSNICLKIANTSVSDKKKHILFLQKPIKLIKRAKFWVDWLRKPNIRFEWQGTLGWKNTVLSQNSRISSVICSSASTKDWGVWKFAYFKTELLWRGSER